MKNFKILTLLVLTIYWMIASYELLGKDDLHWGESVSLIIGAVVILTGLLEIVITENRHGFSFKTYSKKLNSFQITFSQRIRLNLIQRILSKERYEETISNLADLKYELRQEGVNESEIKKRIFKEKRDIILYALLDKIRGMFRGQKKIQD